MVILKKIQVLIFTFLILTGALAGAQTIFDPVDITAGNYKNIMDARAAYVMVNPGYPVVPGDVYQLVYTRGTSVQSASFYVESDFSINLSFFGKMNVQGYTYGRLKREVEALVSRNYPDSVPQVSIQSPGTFMVFVKGEVASAVEIPAWGFMKLSSVAGKLMTPYASARRVEVVNAAGERAFYDLFRAARFGERDQDPFIKRGDTIILHRYFKRVKVDGEVHNPGTFELLPGEELATVLTDYAKGVSPLADLKRVELTRYLSPEAEFGETRYLDLTSGIPEGYELANMDVIKVAQKQDHQPLVYFQGAVGTGANGTQVSNKIPLPITAGERLSFAARRIQDQFTLVSDLEKVLLTRAGLDEPLLVNLQELLLQGNPASDPVLQNGDILVVPFRQYYVYVGGQVNSPGRFPYIANRTYEYYLGLAGGFNIQNHIGKKVRITDVYGNKYKQDERIIQPEDVIYAPLNHPMYWVKEYGMDVALITSSIVSTSLLIWQMGQLMEGDVGSVAAGE